MNVDAFLSRLKDVKKTGHNKWVARCPAHESTSGASLAIGIGDKGGLLIHDFGGCTFKEIVAAADANVSDLLPERPNYEQQRPRRPRASALTPIIAVFEKDIWICALLLQDLGNAKVIQPADVATAKAAARRLIVAIKDARRVC